MSRRDALRVVWIRPRNADAPNRWKHTPEVRNKEKQTCRTSATEMHMER